MLRLALFEYLVPQRSSRVETVANWGGRLAAHLGKVSDMGNAVDMLSKTLFAEWCEKHELKERPDFNPDGFPLSRLVDSASGSPLGDSGATPEQVTVLFDHTKFLLKPKATKTVAVVHTSPYLGRALAAFGGDGGRLQAKIHELASALGLFVRVGHPDDIVHLSATGTDSTLPIVWWNPTRFTLQLPEVSNNNIRFRERIEANQKIVDRDQEVLDYLRKRKQ